MMRSSAFTRNIGLLLLILTLPFASRAQASKEAGEFDIWQNVDPISESEHVRVLADFAHEIEDINGVMFGNDGRKAVLEASNFIKIWDSEGHPVYLVRVIEASSGAELSPMMLFKSEGVPGASYMAHSGNPAESYITQSKDGGLVRIDLLANRDVREYAVPIKPALRAHYLRQFKLSKGFRRLPSR